jgi:hypothetical protein
VAGALWLVSLFVTVPAIPQWIWIALFVVLLGAAQFYAFHDLRKQRDAGHDPGFSLLSQAAWWRIGGYAYTNDKYDTLLGTPEAFVGNPEVKLTFVTDIEMEAHGGTKGGVLFDLAWTMHNLPAAATFEAPLVVMPIALPPEQGAPHRSHLSIQLDKVRLSDLRRVWEELAGDPLLIAQYHVKGKPSALETRLTLSRTRIVGEIPAWRRTVGLPPEG